MNIRQMCGDIRQREILLYGDQDDVEIFLEKYYGTLNIQYVITDYIDDVRLQPYLKWNIETVMTEKAKQLQDSLIVICGKNKFGTLKKCLRYIKKKEYRDYIGSELVEALLYGKKLMVCMGTQMLEQVCNFLAASEEMRRLYCIIYFAESDLMEPYMNRVVECVHVSQYCDVYIRSACEKERFPLKIMDRSIANKECQIITVADFGFGGYYPQIINNRDKISTYLLRGYKRLPMSYELLAASRTDEEIVKLCKKGLSGEDITERLLSPDYYEAEVVQSYFNEQVERFKKLEKSSAVHLGNYLERHKEMCLCRNLNEWNEPVISYITDELLKRIDLPVLSINKEQRTQLIEESSGSEIIIYPSVQKALGLEGMLKDKKYKVVTYYQTRYMDIKEYLQYIIEYLYRTMDIVHFAGMDDETLYI